MSARDLSTQALDRSSRLDIAAAALVAGARLAAGVVNITDAGEPAQGVQRALVMFQEYFDDAAVGLVLLAGALGRAKQFATQSREGRVGIGGGAQTRAVCFQTHFT